MSNHVAVADKTHITLTHLNIRQSVSILVIKLIFSELLVALIFLGSYLFIIEGDRYVAYIGENVQFIMALIGLVVLIKALYTSYLVLQWLNEYYEMTPEFIAHKYGIIFKKADHYRFVHIRRMIVNDSLLGELMNFGTITFYDTRLNKYLDMYMIHNARRYAKIIKEIKPDIEIKEDHTWIPAMKSDDIMPLDKD